MVWINGLQVGQWCLPGRGPMSFEYHPAWLEEPHGRPLSLSLPLTLPGQVLKGDAVGFYFDNLLPDSDVIRSRLQARFQTATRQAFDLLQAIGRDCVGAVQLLPPGEAPVGVFETQAEPLSDAQIARLLIDSATRGQPPGLDEGDFRISIAGAQEKIALTWHGGRWCRPLGATPTTHIFKLPLGRVGNRQADLRTSVENEWLCAQILQAYGVPVANCEIGRFENQTVLIVERFDRRHQPQGDYWLRLPQEDFCQATGTPGFAKYQVDGGPGVVDLARILQGSIERDADLATLMRAQLLFWMLAATDGHAKNFSLHLLPGGRYRLTPLYDVLSAWPVIGTGAHQIDRRKARLAMALRGRNTHYLIHEIERRHFNLTAQRCGVGPDMEGLIEATLDATSEVIDRVSRRLPASFPAELADRVLGGLRQSAQRLAAMA